MFDWQQELAQAICSTDELLHSVGLQPSQLNVDERAAQSFTLRVPRSFVQRMERGNPHDPLLLQVLPQEHELMTFPGYSCDPLSEQQASKIPGLLHKYFGRILLVLAGACAINCRYCFRRHFSYRENTIGDEQLDNIIAYIEEHPEIFEVILSGGDPLILKDPLLERLLEKLAQLNQLRYVRIHTRLPIVLPSRVTDSLIQALIKTRLKVNVVVHCNHAQEINDDVAESLKKLHRHHITLLNQSVLLKNINDDAETLIALSHRLYQSDVLPYYLHLLDAVQGAHHFQVSDEVAKKIIREMQAKLPGFLVPKLVREVPDALSKVLVL